MTAPPGLLWTWFDDRNRVELAIQISRVWVEFATNGVNPWAINPWASRDANHAAVKIRKVMRESKRHRLNNDQYFIINGQILSHVADGTPPARGAESFVEPAVMRWRFKDALDVALTVRRRVDPRAELNVPRRVKQAFEAIVLADEIPTAYQYLGADPDWWSPEPTSDP